MSTGLYTDHFNFKQRPFSLSPDPDFLFWTQAHARAFSVLEYGIMTRAPLTVVTGEVGTGKTTLIQALLQGAGDDLAIGLISNAQGNRDDLLRWVLNALDVDHSASDDYVRLFQIFQDFVIQSYSEQKHVVLIIDEAQNLSNDTLEELRMLTNINSGKDELLQLILVGQPELRQKIERPEMRQFAQRVTATDHINPMNQSTTLDYIKHRLVAAGGTGDEIHEFAAIRVHNESGGIPRIVNKICDLALVYASSAGQKMVDVAIVHELIEDGVILRTIPDPLFQTVQTSDRSERKAAE